MAFSKVNLKHPHFEVTKEAPVGFSWTVFFFGFFPAFFRGDIKFGMIILVSALITVGLSNFIFMFLYNEMYLNSLLDAGYTSTDDEIILAPIEAKLEMRIPRAS